MPHVVNNSRLSNKKTTKATNSQMNGSMVYRPSKHSRIGRVEQLSVKTWELSLNADNMQSSLATSTMVDNDDDDRQLFYNAQATTQFKTFSTFTLDIAEETATMAAHLAETAHRR